MAYCIKCGVKLEDSEKECPLCRTVVYHPDIQPSENYVPPYPEEHTLLLSQMNKKYKILIASIIIFIPTLLTLICDYKINSGFVWSDIVVSSVFFLYCLIFIPLIFSKKDILLYLGIDFSALTLFQWYLSYTTSGSWFFPFAFPLICSVALIIISAILIKRFTKASYLSVFAIIFILNGAECIFIEFLISKTFFNQIHFLWSYYPCITFIAVGAILLLLNRNKKIKDQITKKFFV